jgi:iron(III) transport system substrate-binding protein
MKSGMKVLLIVGVIVQSLYSCGIDKASQANENLIYIASDFLFQKDTTLFNEFSTGTSRIQIVHLDADSIKKKLKAEGYSTMIDIVLVESSIDLVLLSNENHLQTIYGEENIPNIPYNLKGKNRDWFGLAIDPIVIGTSKRNEQHILNYGDLKKSSGWSAGLNERCNLSMLCGFLHRLKNHSDKKSWISGMIASKQPFRMINDSTGVRIPLLNTYSTFYADSSLYRNYVLKGKVVFPNQRKGGVNYVLRGIGLVKQCRNYDLACQFLQYLFRDDQNQRINNWWNTFPVTYGSRRSYNYQQSRFKRYPASMESLSSYLGDSRKLYGSYFSKKKANL